MKPEKPSCYHLPSSKFHVDTVTRQQTPKQSRGEAEIVGRTLHIYCLHAKMKLHGLPENLLGEILGYLPLDERIKACMARRILWKMRESLDRYLSHVQLNSSVHTMLFISSLRALCNMVDLNMRFYGNDDFLSQIGNNEMLMPLLARLSMVSSVEVTDYGLLCLSKNPFRKLQSIDITFCHKTSYAGTFPLRDAYPNMIIRRQPEWMDGQFVTPFDNDGAHTYWCDGTFLFERDQQSCGHVCSLHKWSSANPDHIRNKLQYCDFVPPAGWPSWTRFCYRPGVSLLRLQHEGNDEDEKQVLVGQHLYGLRPPKAFPKYEHKDMIPLDSSRYFSWDSQLLLPEDHNMDDRYIMVSRMKVLRLPHLMPPVHVVQQNRDFCETLKIYEDDESLNLDQCEGFLHHALNIHANRVRES